MSSGVSYELTLGLLISKISWICFKCFIGKATSPPTKLQLEKKRLVLTLLCY